MLKATAVTTGIAETDHLMVLMVLPLQAKDTQQHSSLPCYAVTFGNYRAKFSFPMLLNQYHQFTSNPALALL